MINRPSFRLPIWAALAIAGAAYLVRSLVIRGGSFAPDLPEDAIVAVVLLLGMTLVVVMRSKPLSEALECDSQKHGDDKDAKGSETG